MTKLDKLFKGFKGVASNFKVSNPFGDNVKTNYAYVSVDKPTNNSGNVDIDVYYHSIHRYKISFEEFKDLTITLNLTLHPINESAENFLKSSNIEYTKLFTF